MLSSQYLAAMKEFEGFSSRASWDYAQNSNGYGTRALYAGEVIDKDEAERRFSSAVSKATDVVERFAPNLDEGTKAALTSLTYNAGTTWMQSGLGEAVQAGDMDKARSLFVQYNKAGGSTLDGLVQRRATEVGWFGKGVEGVSAGAAEVTAATSDIFSKSTADVAAAGAAGDCATNVAPSGTDAPSSVVARTEQGGSRGPSIGSEGILMSLLALISKSGAELRDSSQGSAGQKTAGEKLEVPLASA